MGEILPDGSIQSYYAGYCSECGIQIKTNMQGSEISPKHICNPNGGIIIRNNKIKRLKAQNAELLKALKLAEIYLDQVAQYDEIIPRYIVDARITINDAIKTAES